MKLLRAAVVALLWLFVGTAFANDLMMMGVGPRTSGVVTNYIVQEDGTSKILLEDVPNTIGTPTAIGNAGATTDPVVITTTATAAVGETIVLAISQQNANSITSVTDSAGNTYTQDKISTTGTAHKTYLYHTVVTVQLTSGGTISVAKTAATGIGLTAFKATNLAGTVDASGENTGNSTTLTASATSAFPKNLVVGAAGWEVFNLTQPGGSWTSGTGNTASSNAQVNFAYQNNAVPATYTYNPTLNIAEHWGDVVVAYKPTASATTDALILE